MLRNLAVCWVLLGIGLAAMAADTPTPALYSATGTVVSANDSAVLLRPRNPDGTFAKPISLKLKGTSKATVVSVQTRNGKQVLVQRETDAKDIEKSQTIAVIYTLLDKEPVLLSAVVQAATK